MRIRGVNNLKGVNDIRGIHNLRIGRTKGISDITRARIQKTDGSRIKLDYVQEQLKRNTEQLQKNMSMLRDNLQANMAQAQVKLQESVGTARATLGENVQKLGENLKKAQRNVGNIPKNLQRMLVRRAVQIAMNRIKRKIYASVNTALTNARKFLAMILQFILKMMQAAVKTREQLLEKTRQGEARA
jgi:hypothetical protein